MRRAALKFSMLINPCLILLLLTLLLVPTKSKANDSHSSTPQPHEATSTYVASPAFIINGQQLFPGSKPIRSEVGRGNPLTKILRSEFNKIYSSKNVREWYDLSKLYETFDLNSEDLNNKNNDDENRSQLSGAILNIVRAMSCPNFPEIAWANALSINELGATDPKLARNLFWIHIRKYYPFRTEIYNWADPTLSFLIDAALKKDLSHPKVANTMMNILAGYDSNKNLRSFSSQYSETLQKHSLAKSSEDCLNQYLPKNQDKTTIQSNQQKLNEIASAYSNASGSTPKGTHQPSFSNESPQSTKPQDGHISSEESSPSIVEGPSPSSPKNEHISINRDTHPNSLHDLVAQDWVDNLEKLLQCSSHIENFLWKQGAQLAALMRHNHVYTRPPKNSRASFVFSVELERLSKKVCQQKGPSTTDTKCTQNLSQQLLDITEHFWSHYKDKVEKDFLRHGLNKGDVYPSHVVEELLASRKNSNSPIHQKIDSLKNLLSANINQESPEHCDATLEKASQYRAVDIKTTSNNLPGQHVITIKALDIDRHSDEYHHALVFNRYTDQVVQSLACGFYSDSVLFNGQLLARTLRQNRRITLERLNQQTDRDLKDWCLKYSPSYREVDQCFQGLQSKIHFLNQQFQEGIKDFFEPGKTYKTNLESSSIDAYFQLMLKGNASHPINQTLREIESTISALPKNSQFRCSQDQNKAFGDYAIPNFDPIMFQVANHTLDRIAARAGATQDTKPGAWCLRSCKKGLEKARVFARGYPNWNPASDMVENLDKEIARPHLIKNQFQINKLGVIDPEEAPPYSWIVYGNGNGHFEYKVPAQLLKDRGIQYVWARNSRLEEIKVPIDSLDYVYISDYIDAYPRNHPHSRIARGTKNNGRPVIGVYTMTRRNAQ